MAQKKKPVRRSPRQPKGFKKYTTLSYHKENHVKTMVLALLVLTLGFIIYRYYIVASDRHKFEQARTSIEQLYSEIETQVGKPDNEIHKNSCGNSSQEYGHGPLGCSVGINFVYGVASSADANIKANSINTVVTRTNDFQLIYRSNSATSNVFVVLTKKNEIQTYSFDLKPKSSSDDMHCSLSLTYAEIPNDFLIVETSKNKENLSGQLVCSKSAAGNFY